MSKRYQRRAAERIRVHLSNLLQTQVNDARVQMVTLTGVEVDPKVTRAHVYFSVLGGSEEKAEALAGLQSASGYLRRELGQRIRLRNTPKLIFHWDPSMERGERISSLLDQLKDESEGSETEL
jgi:ribosome-binding factor A